MTTPPAHQAQATPSIAITIIGYNEAERLPACFHSTRWADEVIFVDCGSQDNSLEMAKTFTPHVYSRPNNVNLNINKAYAIEQAQSDWIFYLDPDEVIPPALITEIRHVIGSNATHDAYALPRKNHYFKMWLKHGGQYPDMQLRLFKRGKAHFPCLHVHEKLQVEGSIGRLKEGILHYSVVSVEDSLKKMHYFAQFEASVMLQQGLKPSFGLAIRYLYTKPIKRFTSRYLFKKGYKDGWPGLIQCLIGALDFPTRFIKFWGMYNDAFSASTPSSSNNHSDE